MNKRRIHAGPLALALLFCLASAPPAAAQIGEEIEAHAQHDSMAQHGREMQRHRAEMERSRSEMERHAYEMHEALVRAYGDSGSNMHVYRLKSPDSIGRYFYSAQVGRPCARIGITFSDGDSIVVQDVMDGSGADEADVRAGDVIVSVDGESANLATMTAMSRSLEPGDRVRLAIRRDGRVRSIDVTAREDVCPLRTMLSPRPFQVFCVGDDSTDTEVEEDCAHEFALHLRQSLDGLEENMGHLENMPFHVFTEEGDSGRWVRFYGADISDSLFIDLDSVRVFADVIRLQLDSLRTLAPFAMHFADSLRMLMPSIEMELREIGEDMHAHSLMLRSMELGARALAGAHLTELNADLADYFEADEGVLVTRVEDGTPAARAGLRGGDVIVEVNGEDVADLDDVRRRAATADRPLDLTIQRGADRRTIRIAE